MRSDETDGTQEVPGADRGRRGRRGGTAAARRLPQVEAGRGGRAWARRTWR
ncbi:MAG: hypothetical protein MZV63_06170 [Marinilabiliales bacterium]|nr:hypothetical protein [Marinilabiliales bacterium]